MVTFGGLARQGAGTIDTAVAPEPITTTFLPV